MRALQESRLSECQLSEQSITRTLEFQ